MAVARSTSSDHHQYHSTLDAHDEYSLANMVDTEANAHGGGGSGSDVEITAAQKMVSAMSGSLLTSLFCTSSYSVTIPYRPEPYPRFIRQLIICLSLNSHSSRRCPCAITISTCPQVDRRLLETRPHHHISNSRPNFPTRSDIMLSRSLLCWWQRRFLLRYAETRRHHPYRTGC